MKIQVDIVKRSMLLTVKQASKAIRMRWGVLSARLRSLPDFIVIGAQRCGTTSLDNYLRHNPSIKLPAQKSAVEVKYQFESRNEP